MAEISEKVNSVLYRYIADINNYIKIDKAYLFGSYAKGNFNEYSDIDVAIFSDDFKRQSFLDAVSFLFSLARKYKEVCIEPIAFTLSDLHDGNPFAKEIVATGKEIILQ